MWLYILQGIGYGFAAAAQPGPLQTYIISQALAKGWKRSLLVAFAPLVSDGPVIALCLLVLSQVPHWLERFLYIAGGLFVLYLANSAYQTWRNFGASPVEAEVGSGQNVSRAAFVNLLSPGPYIFWSLVTGPILVAGWREAPAVGIVFMLGFYITFILSLMGIILVFGAMRSFGTKVQRTLIGLSAGALFVFGLYQLGRGILG